MEKLNEDIEEIFQDEHLFAHLLDEVLSFELELKEILRWKIIVNFIINLIFICYDYLLLQLPEHISECNLDPDPRPISAEMA